MKKLLTIALSAAVGFLAAMLVLPPRPVAVGGVGENCSSTNGDINADGKLDLSDAITVLGNLFRGTPATLPPLCAGAGSTAGLPATGQTACWSFDGVEGLWRETPCNESACEGQDAAITAGCPLDGRFQDNGDGTVTDNCTGLMWQKETTDVSGDDHVDALGDTLAWCEAVSFCSNLTFAGHDDWRLPNVRELQSIVDYGRMSPAIDPVFGSLPEFYWTSTTFSETNDAAWGVGLSSGYVGIRNKRGDFEFSFNYLRAVRDAK